jgi:hypothetical protein
MANLEAIGQPAKLANTYLQMESQARPHHILPVVPDPRTYITPSRVTKANPYPVYNPGFEPLPLSSANSRPEGLLPTIYRTNSGRFRLPLDHEGPLFYDEEILEENTVALAVAVPLKKKKGFLRSVWEKCKKIFGRC